MTVHDRTRLTGQLHLIQRFDIKMSLLMAC